MMPVIRPRSAGTPEAMAFYQWLTYIEGSAKAPLASRSRRAPQSATAQPYVPPPVQLQPD